MMLNHVVIWMCCVLMCSDVLYCAMLQFCFCFFDKLNDIESCCVLLRSVMLCCVELSTFVLC